MANNVVKNPIVLDTFTANVVLSQLGTGGLTIRKIVLYSAAALDRFSLEDSDGVPIVIISQDTSLCKEVDFGEGFEFTNGVVFDFDDALQNALGTGDYVLIYLK